LLLLAGLWALHEWWRHRRLPPQRLFWLLGAVSGLAAIVAMECGWVVTEVGRQPWVVYQLLTTTGGGHHQRRRHRRPELRHRLVCGTDSFLLKGEHVPPRALWRGNPATEVRAAAGPIDRAPSDRTEVRRLAA
jgi:hypothetical protein